LFRRPKFVLSCNAEGKEGRGLRLTKVLSQHLLGGAEENHE
jgi:hypothetical protein